MSHDPYMQILLFCQFVQPGQDCHTEKSLLTSMRSKPAGPLQKGRNELVFDLGTGLFDVVVP